MAKQKTEAPETEALAENTAALEQIATTLAAGTDPRDARIADLEKELVASRDEAKLAMAEVETLEQRLAATPHAATPTALRRGRVIRLRALVRVAAVLGGERRDLVPGDEFEAAEDEMTGLEPGVHYDRAD